MLESSLHSPIMYPLSSTSTYPSIHFSSSTCTLHWGQAPSIPNFHTYLPYFHLSFIILFHLWSWLSLSFHPSICTFHVPFSLSIHLPTYFHNHFISLILTYYPYLASLSPYHVHSSIFHPYSYILPSPFHISLIFVIPLHPLHIPPFIHTPHIIIPLSYPPSHIPYSFPFHTHARDHY